MSAIVQNGVGCFAFYFRERWYCYQRAEMVRNYTYSSMHWLTWLNFIIGWISFHSIQSALQASRITLVLSKENILQLRKRLIHSEDHLLVGWPSFYLSSAQSCPSWWRFRLVAAVCLIICTNLWKRSQRNYWRGVGRRKRRVLLENQVAQLLVPSVSLTNYAQK